MVEVYSLVYRKLWLKKKKKKTQPGIPQTCAVALTAVERRGDVCGLPQMFATMVQKSCAFLRACVL